MTLLASSTLFGVLVVTAIAGAALGAVVLGVLLVRDWKNEKLW